MKSILYFIGGIGLVAAVAVWKMKQGDVSTGEPVDELAHRLQDAWADHHTVA
jgi:hypothetical protein